MKIAATLFVGGSMALSGFAQQWPMGGASEGITSSGKGRASATITIAEITGTIDSQAELAGDAMVKFKGAKRRALHVIESLEIKNLTVKEKGISVAQSGGADQAMMRQMMGQGGAAAPKPQVQVVEKITLVLTGIDQMSDIDRVNTLARIIDAGTDSGLAFGSSGNRSIMEIQMGMTKSPNIVNYVSLDADAVTDKATKLAINEARKKAMKLAEVSGVKLGKVTAVGLGGGDFKQAYNQYNIMQMMFGMQEKDEDGENRLISAVYQPIPIEVDVTMTFGIQ